MTKPKRNWDCWHIPPFTGKAAEWLTNYLKNTVVDPKEQEKVNAAIRKSARRVVKG